MALGLSSIGYGFIHWPNFPGQNWQRQHSGERDEGSYMLSKLTTYHRFEFYYDCIKRGQYLFRIRDMHLEYGPIVRISPFEVHVSTPDFFNEIYSQTERRDIWRWQRRGFGANESTLSTPLHDHHRKRRAAINPLFSKQRIVKLLPTMKERLASLMKRFETFEGTGEVLNLQHGMAAFACDVGMEYFFAQSQNKVNAPDFDPAFHDAISAGFNNVLPMNHFPWVMDGMIGVAKRTPDWLLEKYFASKKTTSFVTAQKLMRTQVHQIVSCYKYVL